MWIKRLVTHYDSTFFDFFAYRPNTITGLGFLCVVANLLTMFYFAPDMTGVCPSWAYYR